MYLSMNSDTLTNEAMREPPGSLAYELAESLGDEMDVMAGEIDGLEDEAAEASNGKIDCCTEAVWRMEQIEDRVQDILNDVPDHQKAGTYRDMRDNLKSVLLSLNDAVIYFNRMSEG